MGSIINEKNKNQIPRSTDKLKIRNKELILWGYIRDENCNDSVEINEELYSRYQPILHGSTPILYLSLTDELK